MVIAATGHITYIVENPLLQLKRLHPQILHKVLAVVLLPVLLEIGFNVMLYQLVLRAEAMAAVERQQSEIIDHINTITILFANAGGAIASYSVTGSVGYLTAGNELFQQFNRELEIIDRLTAGDPEGQAAVAEFRKLANSEFSQLTAVGAPEGGASYDQAVTNIKGLRSMIRQAFVKSQIVTRVMAEQKKRLIAIRAREEASRRQVKEINFCANVGNLIFVALLLILFLRDITSRLNLLVGNARLLPSGLPLPGHVGGGDELAYLDGVLHEASAELRRAADHREQVMQMVAHDLRSPLMSSQISLEILTSDKVPLPAPPVQKHILGIKHNIALLVGLVNDLLTIDKLEAGKLEIDCSNFTASKLADEAIATVAGLALRREIAIFNNCSEVTLHADPARCQQVLINYLSNAIKFSPKQSQIEISDQIDPRNKKMLCISVQDQGPGVSAEQRQRLFERFYQTKSGKQSQGFGLGLAICKLIVETHGGQVGVESEPGQGSIFWFTLPLGEIKRVSNN